MITASATAVSRHTRTRTRAGTSTSNHSSRQMRTQQHGTDTRMHSFAGPPSRTLDRHEHGLTVHRERVLGCQRVRQGQSVATENRVSAAASSMHLLVEQQPTDPTSTRTSASVPDQVQRKHQEGQASRRLVLVDGENLREFHHRRAEHDGQTQHFADHCEHGTESRDSCCARSSAGTNKK